ncbi:MAG: thioredoxin family protein [Patescibacteria group bacterium]
MFQIFKILTAVIIGIGVFVFIFPQKISTINTPVIPQNKPKIVPKPKQVVIETTIPQISKETSPSILQATFSGKVVGGNISKVYDFNSADYAEALKTDRLIILYFHTDWDPICAIEIQKFYSAMSQIPDDSIIGFRVNFNDGGTSDSEKDLARQFEVTSAQTKIFLKNAIRTFKPAELPDF